ncbi:MAG: FHA domain-containing protein [Lachnospiraceae bacterium]|nr:FHA domain-containing protein [Lachnospiraceae bacterium]MBR5733720.1 FHA domain-containing protein [Lachnospiraceae bacterium]
MQIEQCRSLGRQSMRISETEYGSEHSDFREQMLLHNRVEGILPFEIINENGLRIYEYSVMGMETLKSLCARRKLRAEELKNIFSELLKSVYHGHEFMLLEDDYVVTPETVYTDAGSRTEVAYYSGYGKPLREQLRALSEYMMDNIDYKDDDAVLMIYTFYMKTKEESCTIEDLMGIVNGPPREKEESPEAKPEEPLPLNRPVRPEERAAAMAENAAFREIKPEKESIPVSPAEIVKAAPRGLLVTSLLIPAAAVLILAVLMKTGVLTNSVTGRPDVTKTLLLSGTGLILCVAAERFIWMRFAAVVKESCRAAAEAEDEATLMLCSDGMARYPFSLVSDEYPAIAVGKTPYYVGKDPNTADYVLNKAGVSRYHMKIDKEGDRYTIADLGSTNGTYVNGKRLESYKPQAVRRGDEIRIAACTFYCN